MKKFKEIHLIPGSKEWLLWRRSHICGTDSSKILNKNPWSSPLDCYNEKMNDKQTIMTPAMQRGIDLEPKARELLMSLHGVELKPKVFESTIYPFTGASLDSISDDCETLIEIKCPGEKAMNKAFNNEIDKHYIIQCNKQMLVMGLDHMFLFYYFNEFLHHEIRIERDDKLIRDIIKAEVTFWNKHILEQVPPAKYGDEFERIDDEMANELAKRWNELNEREKDSKLEKDKVAEQLSKYTQEKNCIFTMAGIKHQIIERKGAVDWKEISIQYNVTTEDVEKYRKKTSRYSKFSDI